MQEKTLVLIKPHAVVRGWTAEIVDRYLHTGALILAVHVFRFTLHQVKEFYAEHRNENYFTDIEEAMCEGYNVGIILEMENAVSRVRKMNGTTDPDNAAPGTIRHDFKGPGGARNTVHGSNSVESAEREIRIIFPNLQ